MSDIEHDNIKQKPGSIDTPVQSHTLPGQVTERLEPAKVPLNVHETLRAPGQPLDAETRAFMEPRFGHDFSQVRVHADEKAGQSAKDVSALAYTVGPNIVFGPGRYQPDSAEGKKLIVHELSHTIQQGQGLSGSVQKTVDTVSADGEQEAKLSAASALENKPLPGVHAQPVSMQRDAEPGGLDLAESASPFMARAIGSVTIDGFATDKSEISKSNEDKLRETSRHIIVLLRHYPGSMVRVTGHTDAVGKEGHNMELGEKRADTTRMALNTMGVPSDSIETDSKGETELLVRTDKPEPMNRRVEVKFEPFVTPIGKIVPELHLTPPVPLSGEHEGTKKIDLTYHPPIPESEPSLPPWFWKPLPPPVRGTEPKSPLDILNEKIVDPVVDATTKWLPKNLRDKVKEAAHDAVKSGVAKGARAVAEAAGIKDPKALEAIEKAVEAAIQEKGKSQP